MFAVHVGPTAGEGILGRAYALPHGRASVLFVVVAGVGVSLLVSAPTTSRWRGVGKLVWRAALLLPFGLALQELDHRVAVILQDYAVLFLVAVVLVRIPDRWLLRMAAAAVPVGSVAYLLGQMRSPQVYTRQPVVFSDTPVEALHGLVFSGPYPLITWVAPFTFGIWLGRRDLRSRAVRSRLVLIGGVMAVLAWVVSAVSLAVLGEPSGSTGWTHLAADTAHSQMPLWIIGSTATAAAVLGASLLAADALPRLTRPLVVTGQVALTVYAGHILALHVIPDDATGPSLGPALGLLVLFTVASAVFALGWMRWFRQGPLEAVMNVPWWVADHWWRREPDPTRGPPRGAGSRV